MDDIVVQNKEDVNFVRCLSDKKLVPVNLSHVRYIKCTTYRTNFLIQFIFSESAKVSWSFNSVENRNEVYFELLDKICTVTVSRKIKKYDKFKESET